MAPPAPEWNELCFRTRLRARRRIWAPTPRAVGEGFELIEKTSGNTADSAEGDVESDVNGAELQQVAHQLRSNLSLDERQELAALLVEDTLFSPEDTKYGRK